MAQIPKKIVLPPNLKDDSQGTFTLISDLLLFESSSSFHFPLPPDGVVSQTMLDVDASRQFYKIVE